MTGDAISFSGGRAAPRGEAQEPSAQLPALTADTPARDDQIEAATSLYEGRLLLEAAKAGIETLAMRGTPLTATEMGVLVKLLAQGGDALECSQQALCRLWGLETGV